MNAVLKMDLLPQRGPKTHHDLSLYLGKEVRRIQNRAALEHFADVLDDNLLFLAVHLDFDAGGHVGPFFRAAGQAHPQVRVLLAGVQFFLALS